MDKEITIRKAAEKDLDEIALIMKKEFSKAPYHENWTKESATKTINTYAELGDILVAESDKKIIGFIISREESYNSGSQITIEELVISKELQGMGIGKKLVNEVEEHAKKKNIKFIHLSTNKKAPAYGFYKHLGYIPNEQTVFLRKELK
jgi:ribosomal protein S18 acetylase RimI-like enzyme